MALALVLAFGLVLLISVSLSGLAARTILSTALMFLVAGALIGQGGLGLVDIPSNGAFVTGLADLALFTVLFTDGQRAGLPDLKEGWRLVEDPDGAQGWVLGQFLSLDRTAMVRGQGFADMRGKGSADAKLMWRLEPGVVVGPLINEETRKQVHGLVEDAVARGARVAVGGRPLDEGPLARGYFYAPTVLLDVRDEMRVCREEIFGPVAPVLTFETEAELIARANDTRYGLAAYLYARDLGRVDQAMATPARRQ